MKTTAKVFIWIGMIVQFYFIFPIIIGIFALKKIDEATKKEDLQTWGILTTFFCSLLGGIFMLSIKDEELLCADNQLNKQVVITQMAPNSQTEILSNNKNAKIKKVLTLITFGIVSVVLLLSLCFSISGVISYNGTTFIPLIINAVSLLVLITIFILYVKNKFEMSPIVYILFLLLLALTISQIPISLVTNGDLAYTLHTSTAYDYYGGRYHPYTRYEYSYGSAWEFWVVFGISCLVTILIAFITIFNWINRKGKKEKTLKSQKTTITIRSNVENELLEVQRLFDNKIVTEEEYKLMRSSVINKYYK